jgi:hypothetical protein
MTDVTNPCFSLSEKENAMAKKRTSIAPQIGDKVVVTTEYRGVFFGRLATLDISERTCTLTDARNCVYWPTSDRGFIGLAVMGPLEGSRVGPAASCLQLAGITSIAVCTAEAAQLWEAGPWR